MYCQELDNKVHELTIFWTYAGDELNHKMHGSRIYGQLGDYPQCNPLLNEFSLRANITEIATVAYDVLLLLMLLLLLLSLLLLLLLLLITIIIQTILP